MTVQAEIVAEEVKTSQRNWVKTKRREITRRGVVWLGQTCNLRCYFCYFVERIADTSHPEHPFMSLDKAKKICLTLRYFYGNTSVDIQGGEPTIYPEIFELAGYCREIGLHPTLITNGLVLAKPGDLEKYRDAGVRDFLVSLHGLGGIHDEVVGRKGAAEKIITAIERMHELDIPFRFNCTMSKPVIPLLPQIAQKAVEHGAYGVNYIAFNPFGDQEVGQRTRQNVAKYSDIKPLLAQSIDKLEDAGIETNVRYLPLCMAEERHRKNFYNFQQLSYDSHEWDFNSWQWTMMKPQVTKEGEIMPPFRLGPMSRSIYESGGIVLRDHCIEKPLKYKLKFAAQRSIALLEQASIGKDEQYRKDARARAVHDCRYGYHEACQTCSARKICDGFHGDYAELFGTDEAEPIKGGAVIEDPLHFISQQEKVVEPEDMEWAQ